MKYNSKTKAILMAASLLSILSWSGASRAVPQTGSCPKAMGHEHMAHAPGMHTGGGMDAVAKLADAECSNCHGRYGISTSDDTPNLAGQKPMYMCAWLDGCRAQGNKCEGHEDIAAKLTDQEIIDLSEFYADLPSEKW